MANKILPVDELIPPEYKAQFIRFLSSRWSVICQAAVAEYAMHGRSVLTFEMSDRRIKMVGLSQERAAAFFDRIVLQGEEVGKDGLRVMHKVLKYVETYNPETEMVLWFSFPDEQEAYLKVRMELGFGASNPELN